MTATLMVGFLDRFWWADEGQLCARDVSWVAVGQRGSRRVADRTRGAPPKSQPTRHPGGGNRRARHLGRVSQGIGSPWGSTGSTQPHPTRGRPRSVTGTVTPVVWPGFGASVVVVAPCVLVVREGP